jgi:tetratricopeptide (TPR) repeat protein
VAAARAAGDPAAEWRALLDLGLLWVARDYAEAGELFEQALKLARETGDRAALAHSLNRVGNWQLNQGAPEEAMRRHQEALAIFNELNDVAGQAATYDLLGMTNNLSGDVVAGTRFYQRAAALFQAVDDRRGQVSTLVSLMLRAPTAFSDTVVPAAPLPVAIREGQAALKLARSIHLRSGEAYALIFLGIQHAALGELGPALEAARGGLAAAEAIGHTQWQTAAHFALGIAHGERLDFGRARQCQEQALTLAREIESPLWINSAAAAQAVMCARALPPDVEGARAALAALPAGGGDHPRGLGGRMAWAARAEAALAEGDGAQTLKLVEDLLANTPYLGGRGAAAIPRLARLRGEALTLLGQPATAATLLETAHAEAVRQGSPTEQMRLQLALARAAQRDGQSGWAQAALRQASALAEQMAATLPDLAARRAFEAAVDARLVAAVRD